MKKLMLAAFVAAVGLMSVVEAGSVENKTGRKLRLEVNRTSVGKASQSKIESYFKAGCDCRDRGHFTINSDGYLLIRDLSGKNKMADKFSDHVSSDKDYTLTINHGKFVLTEDVK